jgi:hypothetical protein
VSIKENIRYYLLNRRLKKLKRKRSASNLEVAHSIGLIFNAASQSSYQKADDFAQTLIARNMQVMMLGFVDNKEQLSFYADKKNGKFFSKKDLNWWGKPRSASADFFMGKQFDILIDLSLKESFPIQYIVAMSKAKMKAGKYLEQRSYYDLMIDIRKEPSLDYLIKQVVVYLTMFKVNIYVP